VSKELTEIKVEKPIFIPFKWLTHKYGRAEFLVCPIYKRGKLIEYFIYAKQQENITNYWHFYNERQEKDLFITSYNGLKDPTVCRTFYCKEHKTICIELYVPVHAQYLKLNYDGISFHDHC